MFVCNRCKDQKSTETVCKNCGSWNLLPLGIGTETVTQEVQKQFPKIKVFKFDKEAIKTTKEAKNMIAEFEGTSGSILVGTEMVLPYIDTPLPLSVIASFDSLWSIPNYKISEKIIQIITSILHKTEKKLIIQTKNEQDPSIIAIKNENLLSFVREELKDRENLGYPPYRRFIKITHLSTKEEVQKAKYLLEEMFKEYEPLIFSGFIAKFKNKYATNALIKLNPKNWSLPEISLDSKIDENLLEKLLSLPQTFSINVDPEDLL
jgi:primosomal protein N' (replication factor Y)